MRLQPAPSIMAVLLPLLWLGLASLEVVAACSTGMFECSSGWCIPSDFICDGDSDCADGSDEANCSYRQHMAAVRCSTDEFRCANNACIKNIYVCDGHEDCIDKSDERNCTKREDRCLGFHCVDGSKCLPSSARCDGTSDCNDASDEHNCPLRTLLAQLLGTSNCPEGFECANGHCLADQQVCDSRRDCPSGEDEAATLCNRFACAPDHCDHFCVHHRNGSRCGCRPGFELVNNRTCKVSDICLASGCSQTCESRNSQLQGDVGGGGVTCQCSNGFRLNSAKRCELPSYQGQPLVLFAAGHQVRELDSSHHVYSALYSDADATSTVLSFDMNVAEGTLYTLITDRYQKSTRIMSSARGVKPTAVLRNVHFHQVVDIAVDWVTKNIYVADLEHSAIAVCHPLSEMCVELFGKLRSAHYIILDAQKGRIFWSEFDTNQGSIYQGSMDGSSKKPIVTEGIRQPHGLTIDVFANRLYWIEASNPRVEFVDLSRGARGELIALPTGRTHSGLTVFGDKLYWSDVSHYRSSIYACDKLTGANSTLLVETGTDKFAFTIRAYHALAQPSRRNPCWGQPCSHICVLAGPNDNDFSCLCPAYYSLTSKTQCELSGSSYLLAVGRNVLKVPFEALLAGDLSVPGTAMSVSHLAAMAVDDAENMLYAVEDDGIPHIIRINLTGQYHKEVLNVSIDFVNSLHFDPIHRVLYWLDISQNIVGLYNPRRQEVTRIELHRDDADSLPLDFAVDYRRGRLYVIAVNHTSNERFVDVYRLNGKLDHQLRHTAGQPSRIAIDHVGGTIFIYDAKNRQISSLDILTGATAVVVRDVAYVQHLRFWKDRLVWTESKKRGLFTASESGWIVQHVVREEWNTYTSAIALSDKASTANVANPCGPSNGGCSHTCLTAIIEDHLCICPTGMQLGNDKVCKPAEKASCDATTEFACANGFECIAAERRCDGTSHCADRSDEATAACMTCPAGMHRCVTTSNCVPKSAVCDGDRDCEDGSDEQDCTLSASTAPLTGRAGTSGTSAAAAAGTSLRPPKCRTSDQYECLNTHVCLARDRVCDGRVDCAFGDDEARCPCAPGHFQCPDGGRCLRPEAVCDDWEDCWGGEDERNCTLTCPDKSHKCGDLCIGLEMLCDGRIQCADASDENHCVNVTTPATPTTIMVLAAGAGDAAVLMPKFCAERSGAVWCDGECILRTEVCDGIRDCRDGRDEAHCGNSSTASLAGGGVAATAATCSGPERFLCANARCIPSGLVCDGESDCMDGSDESAEQCGNTTSRAIAAVADASTHCHADEFTCGDRQCIPLTLVCNHNDDCQDGSDEGRHCPLRECLSQPCQHECHDVPSGFRCSCRRGYRLASDHRSCEDIDECVEQEQEQNGGGGSFGVPAGPGSHCSHYCENTKGGYACTCGPGYKMTADNRTCAVEENDPVMLFVAHNQIRAMSKRYHSLHVVTPAREGLISGLTFDATYETIYWSEDSTVWKMPIGDHVVDPHPVLVYRALLKPRLLSLDWITGSLYFVDVFEKIVACNGNFSHCAHIDPRQGSAPIRSLALAANDGLMFFSYWAGDVANKSNGLIIRAEMDGGMQTVISTNTTLKPSHLQVDFIHRRLYVADLQLLSIEHFDFDGGSRRVLLRGHPMHAFALFPDSIFWSENNNIFVADWFDARGPHSIASDAHATMMTAMHRVRQPPEFNPCKQAGCEQLCLRNAHGATCVCDLRFRLNAADNRTCSVRSPADDVREDDDEEIARSLSQSTSPCQPPCLNGGSCLIRTGRTRAVCVCPPGFRGPHCEVVVAGAEGSSSISYGLLVAALLILVVGVGVTLICATYRCNSNFFARFNLSAKYRATDMKKLLDDNENEESSTRSDCLDLHRSSGVVNPLFGLAQFEADQQQQQQQHQQQQTQHQQQKQQQPQQQQRQLPQWSSGADQLEKSNPLLRPSAPSESERDQHAEVPEGNLLGF